MQSQIAMLARDVRQLAYNNAVIQMDMGNGGGMSNSAALRLFLLPTLSFAVLPSNVPILS